MKKIKEFKPKTKISPMNVVLTIILAIYALTIFIAVYFILVSAFKTRPDFDENFFGLPTQFTFNNITDVLSKQIERTRFGRGVFMNIFPHVLMYSALYSIGCAFTAAFVPCITAYFVSKYNYKFSGFLYTLVVVVMIVPIIGNLPATYRMLHALNMYDTIWGMLITKGNFVNMWFLVFFAAFKSLPNDYMEAAYIDGASEFRVMTTVMLPLVKNTFSTVLLIFFVDLWNDYQTPALFMPSHPTLALIIQEFTSSLETGFSSIPVRMASCVIMLVPTVLIFVIFKDKLMGNLTMGGIKG